MANDELTLRDQLALSLSYDSIPTLNNDEARDQIAKRFGLEWSDDDAVVQIEFAIQYEAIIRYMYADAMMNVRD
jgi:hypothetical protein